MKTTLLLILLSFNMMQGQQVQRQRVDVHQHTQADINAFYAGYCETMNTAWKEFNSGRFSDALYYTKRINTSIGDGGFLILEQKVLYCMCFAEMGNKKRALRFYKRVKKSAPPSRVKKIEARLRQLNILT